MSNQWGAYLDFIRIRFLTMLAYRVNYYSGILIYSLNIGVYYFTWKAIYGDGGELGGFTASQMTTYLAVSWMARAFYLTIWIVKSPRIFGMEALRFNSSVLITI